jgi:hypothetical protein
MGDSLREGLGGSIGFVLGASLGHSVVVLLFFELVVLCWC